MNLDSHIEAIWIAIGALCGVGLIFALLETAVWHTRAGKETVDLGVSEKKTKFFIFNKSLSKKTIGKFLLYVINAIGTIFFIVMAGVSLWWLIFFKVNDKIHLFFFLIILIIYLETRCCLFSHTNNYSTSFIYFSCCYCIRLENI